MERRLADRPAAITRRSRLRVIPEPDPDTRSIFTKLTGAPDSVFFASSQTAEAFVCGGCYTPLILGLPITQFQNLVLCCSKCGKYNETLVAGPVPKMAQPIGEASLRHRRRRGKKGGREG